MIIKNEDGNQELIGTEDDPCCCQEIFDTCESLGNMKCTKNVMREIKRALEKDKWNKFLSSKFLKIRHNFFADCFMSDHDIEYSKTDYSLRNIGADSDLSPDIYSGCINGVHCFIEFFVSSDPLTAITAKKEKYSLYVDQGLISIRYIYFDMKTFNVYEDVDQSDEEKYSQEDGTVPLGPNLLEFIYLIKELIGVAKCLSYDSSEVDLVRLTPGKQYNRVNQNIYYHNLFNEYTPEEYEKSIKYMLDKLNSLPDDDKYGIFFDQSDRRFRIKKGSYDYMWLMKSIPNPEIVRNIVVYEDKSSNGYTQTIAEEVRQDEDSDDEFEKEFVDQSKHKLFVPHSGSTHMCLESALLPHDIHNSLKNMSFPGLYTKGMTVESVISDAEAFYKKWTRDCLKIDNIKLKTTFMMPIPAPDRIDDMIKTLKGFGFLNSRLIEISALLPISQDSTTSIVEDNRAEIFKMMDSDLVRSYKLVEMIESRMKVARKSMIDLYGSNVASYRIQTIMNLCKTYVRDSGPEWTPESLNIAIKSGHNLNQIDSEYCLLCLKRTKTIRQTRKIMKSKVKRENMYTMTNYEYNLYKLERNTFLRKRMKGEERMGMNGYSGVIQFDDLEKMFHSFWGYLCQESTAFTDWFNVNVTDESFPDNTQGRQCSNYYSMYVTASERFKKTRIYRLILWISDLARSIWAISTYKTKKRRIIMDRMGTRGTLLFVCSSGNIQKYKSSKAFKVLVPIDPAVKEFCGYSKIPGWEIGYCKEDNLEYAMSHWMYLKVQHLKYFMELPGRWIQAVTVMMTEYNKPVLDCQLYMYLTYCCLNARRKNENLLHDLKYMTYNMFGSRGCYTDLLDDKIEIPRDMLERYIEERFLRNIPKFMVGLKNNSLLSMSPFGSYPSYQLQHPLDDDEEGLDVFNLFVYSSYIFPKGVFTHDIEQSINMRSILEIHSKALSKLGDSRGYDDVKLKTDVEIGEVFSDDLNYNSGVVSAVGLYCEHYLSSRGGGVDMRTNWANIIHKDITEYANSHGLRENDLSDSKSWGKKGHDIMTSLISRERDPDVVHHLEKMAPKTIKEAAKCKWEIQKSKYTIYQYSMDHPISTVELNNANKVQWGGSREIYIMTIGAKNIQWALEKMFAQISHSIDNELIHVSAAERFGKLYDAVKQNPRGVRYYLTLDCRKWAPLSNLNKYLIFVNSMQGILPQEFIEDFNYFFDLYYNKKLFFKESDVKSFLSVNKNEIYEHFFVKSGCGYYIRMPYSFMMGMFNYLSSVLHAISQQYFIDNIVPIIARETHCEIKMVMYAHSDDSGGFIEIYNAIDTEAVLSEVLKEYEGFQKCLNHMLSLKKCTVSTSYFEITSYCFMKTDPMPVLPKFIYGHQINLTPSGYIADVKSISSSVIEMIANGASFQSAFIKYLLLGQTYRVMCLNRQLNDVDSRTYTDLGGFPLIHPYYLCLFKSYAESKWISDMSLEYYCANQNVLSTLGMLDPWGRHKGLTMRLLTMKERKNDGRFRDFEILKEVPDEIIPSGHYLCYMRKMSSRFYKDTMWYSMHDIDGIIIQSNMFNSGMSQTYKYLDTEYHLKDVIIKMEDAVTKNLHGIQKPRFPEYINEIDGLIQMNESVKYRASDTRPKPSEIDTHYNKWWINRMRETKIIALIKICPWMALVNAKPMEYYSCCKTAGCVDVADVMNSIAEEEPLMRMSITTRAEYRKLDRFETLATWIFHNSYPSMSPMSLKRRSREYIIDDDDVHAECLSAMVYEAVSSGKVSASKDIVVQTKSDGVLTYTDADHYLLKKYSNDPMFYLVMGRPQDQWTDLINFIAVKNPQYSRFGRYWVGRTDAFCRINQRCYDLTIQNGTIVKLKCKDRYPLSLILADMSEIDPFGFSYMGMPSKYKKNDDMRITQNPSGEWVWTDECLGMPYYSDIKIDATISFEGRIGFEVKDTLGNFKKRKAEASTISRVDDFKNRQMFLYPDRTKEKNGHKRYRAYILHKRPCQNCLSKCFANGSEFYNGNKTVYTVDCSKEALKANWIHSRTYQLLYNEYKEYRDIISDSADYMGQIGTYLSAIYTGPDADDGSNYYSEYRGELFLSSMAEMSVDQSLIDDIRTNLSKFVRFKLIGDQIKCVTDPRRISSLIAEHSAAVVSAALVTLPLERTMEYYSLMTYDDYWYNNTQIVPEFMIDTLSYINATIKRQPGELRKKKKIFELIINEIFNYLTTEYYCQRATDFRFGWCEDIWLFHLLKQFKDVGDPDDNSISARYYYDPVSIYGCLSSWMRYIMVYSGRRNGKLVDNYKTVYNRAYSGFYKKYKSIVKDKFQITISGKGITEIKAFICKVYSLRGVDFSTLTGRIFPLKDCYGCDLTQNPEWFEDDIMTKDAETSMLDTGYNPQEEYDYRGGSIYMVNGAVKRIRCVPREEWSNWVLTDIEQGIYRFKHGGGMEPIGVSKYGFKYGGDIINLWDPETGDADLTGQLYKENNDVLQYMIDTINSESKAIDKKLNRTKVLGSDSDRLTVNNSVLNALMNKFAIFSMAFDVSGNLTPLLEGKRYEYINNLSQPLNDSLFDQMSIAEMNVLMPDAVELMETDSFRLQKDEWRRLDKIHRATIYSNVAYKITVNRILGSAMKADHGDTIAEKCANMIEKLINFMGVTYNAERDEEIPEPKFNGFIHYNVKIGL